MARSTGMLNVETGHVELRVPASNLDITTAEGAGTAAGATALGIIDAPSAATIEEHEVQPRPIPESRILKVDLVSSGGSRRILGSRNRWRIHG